MMMNFLSATVVLVLLSISKQIIAKDGPTSSPKRGLIFIQTGTAATDISTWDSSSSDLDWYYNYGPNPTPSLPSKMQFVPMFFGAPSSGDAPFHESITSMIKSGANITHILGFNEPDAPFTFGGSNLDPVTAASLWKDQVEPLKGSVKLGAPCTMSNDGGLTWLAAFYTACDGGCTADFYPLHYYGDFQGLASYMGQFQAAYGNTSKLWITEYAESNQPLEPTQSFFNESMEYFDRLSYVERYSYFGSFRSDVSNVGPNPAMLNSEGKLTDIGSWYLGGSATGVLPNAASRPVSASTGLAVFVLILTTFCIG